jgi:hypothetical protein
MRRFALKRSKYDNKEGCEGCIDLGAGPGVPPMAEITLDINHALSREDQRQNRRQPYFVSPSSYSFSGNWAAKFSKKYGWPARNTQKMLTLFSRQARPPYGGTSPCRRGDSSTRWQDYAAALLPGLLRFCQFAFHRPVRPTGSCPLPKSRIDIKTVARIVVVMLRHIDLCVCL